MARSILFTNLYLGAYTGSELHVLKLATEFKKLGWDVTCYTFVAAYPLLEHFLNADISIVEHGKEELLAGEYDVLYAQHHILSDYLLTNHQIAFKRIVVSMLGVKTMHEFPPAFASNADLAVFVSEECKDAYTDDFKSFAGNQLVMPNYADDELFDRVPINRLNLKRIAVVSNHVATELQDLKSIVSSDVEIDYFGLSSCAVEVTPDLLDSYDLVVTIGRTVIDCMALCIPVYCYDIFGGPGYLAQDKLGEHGYANYSGRSHPIKLDALGLWADMQSGYEECLSSLPVLRAHAYKHNRFSVLFTKLLTSLGSISDGSPHKNPFDSVQRVWQEKYALLAKLQNHSVRSLFGTAYCFIHNEMSGEERTVALSYRYKTEIDVELKLDDDERLVRFRPDVKPCACCLNEVACTPLNSNQLSADDLLPIYPGMDSFLHSNPIYRIDEPCSKLSFHAISYDANRATCELHRIWASSQQSVKQLRAECLKSENDIVSMEVRIDALSDENREKDNQIEKLENDVGSLKEQASVLGNRIQALEHDKELLEKTISIERAERSSLWWTIKHVFYLIAKRIGLR